MNTLTILTTLLLAFLANVAMAVPNWSQTCGNGASCSPGYCCVCEEERGAKRVTRL